MKNSTKIHSEMMDAFVSDDFEAMKKLISSGLASVNSADPRRNCQTTPLMRAAMSDENNNFLKWLIANGANVNQKDSANWTALHFSCEYKCKRNIEFLIQSGASVNEKNSTGATPLLRLLAQNTSDNFELAKILIINGADPFLQNNAGVSPNDVNPDLIKSLINN
ncbi:MULTISPECIES: ankyrin repeat domain-containing protein [unclassified Delftia]|uniref:ankyrin repeat domain-containing protein n=1 Tax=Delftia TaxID=80865 RepID=UPI00135DD780|nr:MULTISPECIES: ankyrin repeat domain-containing protein [unclassified Delftia]MXN32831.1 hypothetical protein [Delftia sp. CH05]